MKLYTAIGKYEFRVSGHGVTGVNALHNLLTRSAAFLHLTLMKHVPLQVTRKILEKPQFNETEKQLSEGEPVKCVECGITDVSTNDKLVDAQYDGLFLACNASLKHKAVARSNISSATAGKEGLFNLGIVGHGILCLESPCPKEELVEINLDNDVLKVDGNMAIVWSGSLDFTGERSGKTLVVSAASGEGLVNVYRGTGRVLLAPAGKGIV